MNGSKKILFLPNDLGGGLGHLRRSLRIATMLNDRDWRTAFVVHKKKSLQYFDELHKVFYEPFYLDKSLVMVLSKIKPVHNYPSSPLKREPFFWEFGGGNYQILRDGYFTPPIVSHRFLRISKIINLYKPDIIIGDGHLLTYFLGIYYQIPILQITRYSIFPENPNFIWWKKFPGELKIPNSTEAFTSLYEKIKKEPSAEAVNFFTGDAYLIPGIFEIEPVTTLKPHIFYGYGVNSEWDHRLIEVDKKKRLKKIFITIGGGSARSNLTDFYSFILRSIKNLNFQVIISDPFEVLAKSIVKENNPNISVFKWIESSTIFPYLNIIIHHGGYSTTMESLWWGVPSLIIPFHSEQEGNGRRIEQLKAGKVDLISKPPYQEVPFQSYYDCYNMLAGFNFDLSDQEFIESINKIIDSRIFRKNALSLSEKLKLNYDPDKMLNFIQQYC